ncbi:deoxyribose-phosphate aldolase [Caldimonas brevitalea]|uniref:Deoxyribose-phosphate aldolase n=1 Tax=Caldimonas brevitalea TaxID=413882 RepID=A0A0G3BP73_9BURK|nr:deoxyribose-phosphate aldolase [Caldimonas brevitalea]AKJ29171.1 deoxyribose-phosphate aldolase [Caldimonas brevitalea]
MTSNVPATAAAPLRPDSKTAAAVALRCLDLTSLRDDDTTASIQALAARAATPHGAPAALCIHAPFVAVARAALHAHGLDGVRVATVVNFPHGQGRPDEVVHDIEAARAAGADEIDMVFPWRALLAGDRQAGSTLVAAARRACDVGPKPACLKVILETGELREPRHIREAAEIAAAQGADFLKTSTGKVAVHATPEAAACLLDVIRAHGGRRVGLKVSGGLANVEDVQTYLALAAETFGPDGLTPDRLRFGASSLLTSLLAVLDGRAAGAPAAGY